jgi:hypothetical protein
MKTRSTYFIIGLIFICLDLTAGNPRSITYQEAAKAANQQIVRLGKQSGFILKEGKEISKDGLILAYAFDLEPEGYIVVASSTGLSPVIAYSFESDFGDMKQGNQLFELLKEDLSERVAFSNNHNNLIINKNENLWEEILSDSFIPKVDPLFEQWPATGNGWLKTNWTQDPPYNNFCPMDPVTSQRSYAGCPSTAMAQIINFHATTNDTHFDDSDDYYHTYAGRQYWIDDDCEANDFPCFPALNIYLDTLNAHYLANVSLTDDDKAAMTFACGLAARQVYTSQGSGTFGVSQAYDAYIRFGCSTVELLDSSDADLFDRLKQNIKDTLPAHLAVVDESWSSGHNVVVDGYNTDDYYHLNFGWGGSYNGWYLLPEEIPYNLTVVEGVVVDIMEKIPTGIMNRETVRVASSVYPNPVRNIVYLNYSLKERGPVILSIFNSSGKIILNDEYRDQMPGQYSVPISFQDQSSGIYFYTLRTAEGFFSGKVIKVE